MLNQTTTISSEIVGTSGLTTTGNGTLILSGQATFSGGVTVNGGSLVLQRPTPNGGTYISGSMVVNSGASLTYNNSSGTTLDGGWGNALAINNGTVNVTGRAVVRYSGFSMTGGTFNWNASGGGFYGPTITTYAASATATIAGSGGGYSQPYTFNVARGTAAVDLTVSMPIKGAGASIALNGGGIMQLTGDNTYAGTTTLNQGTLLVDGAIDNSAVSVNANATLGGIGVINGTVAVNSGGTLAPGTTNLGALTLANTLTLDSGSTTFLRITKTGGSINNDTLELVDSGLTMTAPLP